MRLFRRTLDSSRAAARLSVVAIAIGVALGCDGSTLDLTRQVEARRLVSTLRVRFSKAADASNRAVMTDTDEASSAAAREAEQATQAVQQDVDALQPLLEALEYRDEIGYLDTFKKRFAEYRTLDAEILPLAVENTNIKAQRLSFGPARDAASAFRQSLEKVGPSVASKNTCCVDALIGKATGAVLEIQVIQARHIAESDEAAMSRMETEISAQETAARRALDTLKGLLAPGASPQLAEAAAALDRFKTINAEIVTLSRRNSNVRSLAMSLGRKRTVTAVCEETLHELEDALSRHDFKATR